MKLILLINILISINTVAQILPKLEFITNNTNSVISPNLFLDNEKNRIYYLKNKPGDLHNSILCYYDINANKNYEISNFLAYDFPEILGIENNIISLFVPVSLSKFQIVEINTENQQKNIKELPDSFKQIYFSSFFKQTYVQEDLMAFAFDHPYLKTYHNGIIRDSIRLEGKILNTYYDQILKRLYCLERKSKSNSIEIEVIDMTKNIIINNYSLGDFDNVQNGGLIKISNGTLAIWVNSDSYRSTLLFYSEKEKIIMSKNAFSASINDIIPYKELYYFNLTYHSGNFYEMAFNDKTNKKDSITQNVNFSMNVDIIGNLFSLVPPLNNNTLFNIDSTKRDTKEVIDASLSNKYPSIYGVGQKSIEVDLGDINFRNRELEVLFQALTVKDKLQVIQIQNGIKQIIFDTKDLIKGQITTSIPLDNLNSSKIVFNVITNSPSSNWSIEYGIKGYKR